MRTVLFVCTGNTCRSPMAEAIARQALLEDPSLAGPGPHHDASSVFVASAGVSALDGIPTTVETVEALHRRGIEFDGTSKRLTAPMIRKAAWVVAMTEAHARAARALVAEESEQIEKITRLDPASEIEDPMGMGQREYDALADRLRRLIPQRLRTLLTNAADRAPTTSEDRRDRTS